MKLYPSDWFTLKYWAHIVILATAALFLLDKFVNPAVPMFTLQNVLVSAPILGVSDALAHTIMQIE